MSASKYGMRTPEEEAESSAKHRLAEDAEWKVIQKNTFTRWINERLKLVNKHIENIETDLSDGLNLISLLEVLSGKKFQRYTKKPLVRTQKLENITMALKFLQVSEKIKIVNIDSSDIVDHNTKLILGLVWMLILHYAISAPNFELNNYEEMETNTGQQKEDLSPKQRLLRWINSKIVDIEIRNFTSDWNDGRAIGALVDGIAPGLCPDWELWKASDAVKNSREAMTLAENWLDVPQLIKPEEMCNPRVDEMSVMTYLSQFPSAQLKPGAPLKPRTNRSRIRVFGLKNKDVKVGEEAEFTVETFHAGDGDLVVELLEPDMNKKQVDVAFNNDKYATYTCNYTPEQEGMHQIKVFYAGLEIPKSPFSVEVAGSVARVAKITANGQGLQKTGNMSNIETSFTIRAKYIKPGDINVIVTDPNGNQDLVKPKIARISDEELLVSYIPLIEGVHAVDIKCAGHPSSNASFSVGIAPNVDLSKWSVSGRGIQRTGLRVGSRVQFKILTPDGCRDLKVEITDRNGTKQMFNLSKVSETEHVCEYLPLKPGIYSISVTCKDKHINKSPYIVEVKEGTSCPVKAYGPGLSGGIVGYPASFYLETNGDSGSLAFSIEGPSKAEIDCLDNEDGSALITYHPIQPGEYAVHILCNDEDINDSPFIATISEPHSEFFDPSKVKVTGPLTTGKALIIGAPSRFEVNSRDAGRAILETSIRDSAGNPVEIFALENKNDISKYEVTPKQAVRHCLLVSYGGIVVPGCPFKFNVSDPSDPSKVLLQGPALENNVLTSETTYLLVDCSKAGPGDVAIMLSDDRGMDVPMETEEYGVSSFKVSFKPTRSGIIEGKVYFADQEIPLSPFLINVKPSIEVSKIHLRGLENHNFLDSPMDFIIDAKEVDGIENMKATATTPSGKVEYIPLCNNHDGTYSGILTMHEEGPHDLVILCNEVPLDDISRVIFGKAGCDPSQVKVHGPGIKSGTSNKLQTFEVQTKGAGVGGLKVSLIGPREARVTCRDNRDGTYRVEYLPLVRGLYEVSVLFGESHVPESPFKVEIKDDIDPTKIRFDDLERIVAKKGHESKFDIDTRLAGQSDLKVLAFDPHGSKELPVVSDGDGIHGISFMPLSEGLYSIEVWYGGEKVRTSKVQVHPSFDASKVLISGAGVSGNVPASMETSFQVDASEAGEAELVVKIEDHLACPLKYNISKEGNGIFKVKFRPDDVGHCLTRIFYGGDEVSASPVRVAVVPSGEASKVEILGGNDSKVLIGREVRIPLSCADAGVGRLKCTVESDELGSVPVHVSENGEGSEMVYLPSEKGTYNVRIFFGGREVPGGSFQQEAVSRKSYEEWENEMKSKSQVFANGFDSVDDVNRIAFRQFCFSLPMGPVFGFLKAEVTTPNGITEVPEVVNNPDGTVAIKYLPNQGGHHFLNITCNGNPVDGFSPLHFQVDPSSMTGKIKATGPGLTTGMCNSMSSFNVAFSDSDFSDMAISIEGPSKVHIDLEDAGNDSVNVYYKPTIPGDYVVSILHSHQHIGGSPFTAKILPLFKDLTLAQMTIGSNHAEPLNLGIDASASDLSKMTCVVHTPSGSSNTAMLRILEGHKLGVIFDAKEPGNYSFEVFRNGAPIRGSPIKKFVSSSQCSNVDTVKVYGSGLQSPKTRLPNEFFIDYKKAGVGGLHLSIDGPSKVNMECVEDKDGVCKIHFIPSQPGTYVLTILFSSEHVIGSPFLLDVVGEGEINPEPVKGESLVHSYSAISHIGKESLLSLMIPASSKDGLRVFVSGPSGFLDSCYFVPSPNSNTHYSIGFVPKEVGLHLVHVNDGKKPLPGSPFTFVVGPLFSISGGQNNVKVSGSGLTGGFVGVPGLITIDSRLAGEGNLSITMEGTLKPDINFKDKHDGTCDVMYTCSKPGDYLLTIKFNGKHVRGSPFAILIEGFESEDIGLANKKTFNPNEPAFLEVVGDGKTKGGMEAIVRSPSGSAILPIIQERNSDGYIIRFIPREKGLHSVEVLSNGKPLGDSPYKIFVGEVLPDANKVICTGSGLSYGRTGEYSEFQIASEGSGFGSLDVSVDGPSQVNLTCRNVFEKPLKFLYKPSSPGLYKINVCFAGKPIPSSPFVVEVSGPGIPLPWNEVSNFKVIISPGEGLEQSHSIRQRSHSLNDPPSVICTGEGLGSAIVHQSTAFSVDASTTNSHEMLTVEVLGPSGPCREVSIGEFAPMKYLVTYQARETGSHTLVIRWGENHVQGSPFHVLVSQTAILEEFY